MTKNSEAIRKLTAYIFQKHIETLANHTSELVSLIVDLFELQDEIKEAYFVPGQNRIVINPSKEEMATLEKNFKLIEVIKPKT